MPWCLQWWYLIVQAKKNHPQALRTCLTSISYQNCTNVSILDRTGRRVNNTAFYASFYRRSPPHCSNKDCHYQSLRISDWLQVHHTLIFCSHLPFWIAYGYCHHHHHLMRNYLCKNQAVWRFGSRPVCSRNVHSHCCKSNMAMEGTTTLHLQ